MPSGHRLGKLYPYKEQGEELILEKNKSQFKIYHLHQVVHQQWTEGPLRNGTPQTVCKMAAKMSVNTE